MLDLLLVLLAIVSFLVIGALFLYSTNYIYLTLLVKRKHLTSPKPLASLPEWPFVTVQLPVYNELYVVERLIQAAIHLDYPPERLAIQVLDDSTDETVEIVRQAVARAKAQGVNITHLHRTNRTGFKAGALQAGLERTQSEFIAMFDADFVPSPDFLKRALLHFDQERVAFVQARWEHLNRDYSFLTHLQSMALDAHFMVEQFARSSSGYWFNFNGTAGIWRRAALEDAGGWQADTLTEDLDLSYRAHLCGWQARYIRELAVPAELPVSFHAFRRQQHRWARGSLECTRKLLPQIWQAPLPLGHKWQATLHLTGYCVHLLLFILILVYPFLMLLSQRYPGTIGIFSLAYLFNVAVLAHPFFFVAGQQELKRKWWRLLPYILFTTILGAGLMMNTVRAAWQIWIKKRDVFERTAKFGIEHQQQSWMQKRYQLKLDPIIYLEIALAFFNLGTVLLAVQLGDWPIMIYAALFGIGLISVAALTLAQSVALYRHRRRLASIPAMSKPVAFTSDIGD